MDSNNCYEKYFTNRGVNVPKREVAQLPPYLHELLIAKDKTLNILDIGCGYGNLLFALENSGFNNIQGLDVSEQAVAFCRSQGLDVYLADITEYHPKKRFDFVIMNHVLEHLPKDKIIPTLSKIRQIILKKGGYLLVMVPNAQSNTDCYWAYEDFTHNTLFTGGSLLFVLRQSGYSDLRFLDKDGLAGIDKNSFEYHKRKLLLELYITNKLFWNKVTASSYHRPSPLIFTYEIKCLATCM